MHFHWKELPQPDQRKMEHLSNLLRVSQTIACLLVQRGIDNFDDAHDFFNPSASQLHDPFLMLGMKQAVDRVIKAKEQQEKILIYGDYDVDGTTAVATVYSFFKQIISEELLDYYIPDRYQEGYGISKIGIDYAGEHQFSLIIALDCGTRSHELIAYAQTLGIDFIVCDHHLPGDQIPNAVALLNPKQPLCEYPYKELSGCGIGFKFIQAMAIALKVPEKKVFHYLDLVAVSIASDMVDMMGENRVLMSLGLQKLNETPCVGIQALLQHYQIKDVYDANDIVFGLGPRINASGRISDAKASVKLLAANDFHEAIKSARILDDFNTQRKDKDAEITFEALDIMQNNPEQSLKKSTVLLQNHWHKGVIGIVASRLIESHYKPTIICCENEGIITCSARSVKNFDIHEAIGACSRYILQFGGHKYAAGLSLLKEHFDDFAAAFEDYVSLNITEDCTLPFLEYDTVIALSEIDTTFMKILDRFKPYGPGNQMPVFRANRLSDTGYSRILKEKHLKLFAKQLDTILDGIGFSMHENFTHVKNGEFDCCFTPEWNHYNGKVSIQLKLKDLKPCVLVH
jgi:single-stranded-DNA-specific exonuclease